jgi:tetratricopeptide (TPR) repeat protein
MLGAIDSRQDEFDHALARFQLSLIAGQQARSPWAEGVAEYSLGVVWDAKGDYVGAREHLQRALVLLREAGDDNRVAMTLHYMGTNALCLGDYDEATRLLEESLPMHRRVRDDMDAAWSLVFLGVIARCKKNHDRAMGLLEEGLLHFREANLKQGAAYALCEMGIVATRLGDFSGADSQLRESLAMLHAANDRSATAKVLEALANVRAGVGQLDRSAHMLGSAEALRTSIGAPVEAYELDNYKILVSTVSKGLGKVRFGKAWAEGKGMQLEDAVTLAMQDVTGVAPYSKR